MCQGTARVSSRSGAEQRVSFRNENAVRECRSPGFRLELKESGDQVFRKGREQNGDFESSVEISWNDFQAGAFGVWLPNRKSGQDCSVACPDYRELRFPDQAVIGSGGAGSMLSKSISISPGRNRRFGWRLHLHQRLRYCKLPCFPPQCKSARENKTAAMIGRVVSKSRVAEIPGKMLNPHQRSR
jgi:hypothetical protein